MFNRKSSFSGRDDNNLQVGQCLKEGYKRIVVVNKAEADDNLKKSLWHLRDAGKKQLGLEYQNLSCIIFSPFWGPRYIRNRSLNKEKALVLVFCSPAA
jgi:hypothetical protein